MGIERGIEMEMGSKRRQRGTEGEEKRGSARGEGRIRAGGRARERRTRKR